MVQKMRISFIISVVASLLIFVSSCARYIEYSSQSHLPPILGFYHTVDRGDSLSAIANRFNVNPADIASANKLSDPDGIEPGQMLYIPLKPRSALLEGISASQKKIVSEAHFIWPLQGEVITRFGIHKNDFVSKGIDIGGAHGEKVRAAKSGRVSFADAEVSGMGKMIVIDHSDGEQTVYAHNSEILVKVGESVNQNDIIALVGSTGRAEMPFLHFEIRRDYRPVDPLKYLK